MEHVPDRQPRVAVEPHGGSGWIGDAVRAGGGEVVAVSEATALVWTRHDDPAGLAALLAENPTLDWVQLPWAGVEPYLEVIDDRRRWTCGKGVYAEPVAELAVTLLVGALRNVASYTRSTSWSGPAGRSVFDARITILGGGGIARAAMALLGPYRARVTVVRRSGTPVEGAERTVGPEQMAEALAGADGVILALPLLRETEHVLGAEQLALLPSHAVVVNVARGRHVDTAALVEALRAGRLGGAGLDVTDPEPLPDGHPLWTLPNVVITPHVGNTPEMARPLLSARIRANVGRYAAGEELIGPVDPGLGY